MRARRENQGVPQPEAQAPEAGDPGASFFAPRRRGRRAVRAGAEEAALETAVTPPVPADPAADLADLDGPAFAAAIQARGFTRARFRGEPGIVAQISIEGRAVTLTTPGGCRQVLAPVEIANWDLFLGT